MSPIDQNLSVNFSPESLQILNLCLGFIMFVVALDLSLSDFKRVVQTPKSAVIGLLSQFLFLPAVTFALIWLMKPQPAIALGMLLVASCPGGVISNFMTNLAKGNTALSVSLTAVSTPASVFMTPLNFAFWGSRLPETNKLLETVSLNPSDMAKTIVVLIIIPVVIGMFMASKFPALVSKIRNPFKVLSFILFGGFIVIAAFGNWDAFINYIEYILLLVLVHNALAFGTGYLSGRIGKLKTADVRSITIETGIQNSGLGLILIFNFFDGMGPMALVAAWWGVWHIISGLTLATLWSKKS